MPSNPMQRKIKNAFIFGMLITIIVVAAIFAVVFFVVIQPKTEVEKKKEESLKKVCVLNTSVKSGDEITIDMVETVEASSKVYPSDAISMADLTIGEEEKIIAKVNLESGTILSAGLLAKDKNELSNTLRYTEYNMITMPVELYVGDYVDIRLRLSNAQDLVVVSKKQIVSLYGTTVGFNLTEEEILILNSAIVESYAMPSSELYMAKYIEPGRQETLSYTYSPSETTVNLIQSNPNIVSSAREAIANRYNNSGAVRNPINAELNAYGEDRKNNVQQGMEQQIENARKAREQYLSELEGY